MGWAVGFDENWNRDIGYGVPATCDHPGCSERIDRGLGYVCGSEPYGGEHGCGLFFCGKHMFHRTPDGETRSYANCRRCLNYQPPYKCPSPDLPEWIEHKETDPSWAGWRAERDRKAKTKEKAK